jgi:hypothetical protein
MEIVNRQVRLKELSDRINRLQFSGQILTSHVALMQYIETQCDMNHLVMIQLPKETLEDIEGYEIAHVDFSVQGNFHDIVALLYQLEAKDKIGSIAKADLELKTMRMSDDRRQLLIATIRLNRLVQKGAEPAASRRRAIEHKPLAKNQCPTQPTNSLKPSIPVLS